MRVLTWNFSCAAALALSAFLGNIPASGLDESSLSPAPARTVLLEKPFDRDALLAPDYRPSSQVAGFAFLNPNRFSMRQSYSVGFASGSAGSYSSGLYLNTLSYKLANPLTLSADVGFATPFYSNFGGLKTNGFQNPGQGSSLVFPRVGLDYKPSEHTEFSLQLFNARDAYKAYGSPTGSFYPW